MPLARRVRGLRFAPARLLASQGKCAAFHSVVAILATVAGAGFACRRVTSSFV